MPGSHSKLRILILISVLLLSPPHSVSQANTRRLILKDGSYQIATKWEVKGDRVRYFSAERNEWEEIPNSMVDWDATNQYERDRTAGKMSPQALALNEELEAERQQEELKSPHVAPGLRLPAEGGVYALDTYLTQPQLVALDQTGGDVNRHTAHNVLRAAINPLAGSKHTIELPGPRSKLQVHASLPAIYVNLDAAADEDASSKTAELPWNRFHIVRAQVKGDKRIVGAVKTTLFGKISPEQEAVPATVEQLGEGWIKVTPNRPLEPGEYALAEMLGKQGMNSYVWDFGVHPDAPANLAVIRADASELKKSSDQPVKLKKSE
jgi:hypothetical protein